MLWKKAYESSLNFVQIDIGHLLASKLEQKDKVEITVCSTHTSKSILLPVFEIKWNIGEIKLLIRMRDNFYNWKISVECSRILSGIDLDELITTEEDISPIYCEGFKKEWVFPNYQINQRTFTIEIIDTKQVYIFFWLLRRRIRVQNTINLFTNNNTLI